ncbi:MAG: 2-C-methyl-D-erythritol 2,4-cyclodiphosphate synthase [Ruminococcaceae bacterium]|nr:2-C-methyl-D-erythritol 2,4-cyclodiphosphate synthase [Oscillospiraceae bacterium]
MSFNFKIGHGYDVHRLVEDRKLILGGIEIPHSLGLLGHSDADVLLHAISDSLLGAAALGDIGKHFPDTDEQYKGADSAVLLAHCVKLISQKGFSVGNIDATIIAQKPKLAPYIPLMKRKIANILAVSEDCVNIKATTEEKLGFTGSEEGIAAHCVAIIVKKPSGAIFV